MHREHEIVQWGRDKGINKPGSSPFVQMAFLTSEMGELYQAMAERTPFVDIKDAIGDCYVVCCQLAEIHAVPLKRCYEAGRRDKANVASAVGWLADTLLKRGKDHDAVTSAIGSVVLHLEDAALSYGWTLAECVEVAWIAISGRKGTTSEDGAFIKEGA